MPRSTSMQRDVGALVGEEYELVIIGGGINGVAAVRDAALRGVRVALLEKGDFGWATSSQTATLAHSGMRYLQHADLTRMRESVRERNTLVANAPHLVDSLPFLLPLYGHGIKGRETTAIYLKIFDLLSLDRRAFTDESRRIPGSKIISPKRVLEMAPGAPADHLTGGGIWSEGQMHSPERLLLSYLRSAVDHGARAANYVEVTKINAESGRVTSVDITDRVSGRAYHIGTEAVLNATGPWAVKTLMGSGFRLQDHGIHLSKAFSLVTRPLSDSFAVSFPIPSMYRDRSAVVDKGASMQFAIPWGGASIVGSLHLPCDDEPDDVMIAENEVQTYIELINEGYPAAKLTRSDVRHILWGLIPAEEPGSAAPLKHYRIIDHGPADGIHGLVTLVGVKHTTARDVAEKAVDIVLKYLKTPHGRSTTGTTPVWGGDIEHLQRFMESVVRTPHALLAPAFVYKLVRSYGTRYVDILRYVDENPALARPLPESCVTEAEVVHAIRNEMALSLTDLVQRRTDLGSAARPSDECVAACADLMGRELGWDAQRRADEVQRLEQTYELGPLGRRG